MSLYFGADNNNNNVSFGTGSSLTALTNFTIIVQFRLINAPNSVNNRHIAGKGTFAAGERQLAMRGNTIANYCTFSPFIRLATTSINFTGFTIIPPYRWTFNAVSYNDTTKAAKLWYGDDNTPVRFDSLQVGSGALSSDTGHAFYVGDNPDNAANSGPGGDIAWIAYYARDLQETELRLLQRNPAQLLPACVLLSFLGQNGTGTQMDLSGNANNGTVTGAIVHSDPYAPLIPVMLEAKPHRFAPVVAAAAKVPAFPLWEGGRHNL